MILLHMPVLSSASDHFLVQNARIDTNSLPSPSTLSSLPPSSFFLSLSFCVSVYHRLVKSVLTGIVIISDSTCTCAAARGRHMVQVW